MLLGAFDDEDVTHVDGCVDPTRDIKTILNELRLKDVEYFRARFVRAWYNLLHRNKLLIKRNDVFVLKK